MDKSPGAQLENWDTRQQQMSPLSSGSALERLISASSLSQATIAERVGVSKNTVTSWKRGYHRPQAEHALRLAEILACDVTEVLGDGHTPSKGGGHERSSPLDRAGADARLSQLREGLERLEAVVPDLMRAFRQIEKG